MLDEEREQRELHHNEAAPIAVGACGRRDIQVVKERLGHSSLTTTVKHLHKLADADQTARSAQDASAGRSG